MSEYPLHIITGYWKCENPECPLGDEPHDIRFVGNILDVVQVLNGWGITPSNVISDDETGTVFTDERGSYLKLQAALSETSQAVTVIGDWKCSNPYCELDGAPHDIVWAGTMAEAESFLSRIGIAERHITRRDDDAVVFEDGRGTLLTMQPARLASDHLQAAAMYQMGGEFGFGFPGA